MPRSIDAYLATLPAGLDSFPDACIKGALVRSFAEDLRERLHPGAELHPTARRFLDDPPLASSWVPDVWLHVLYLASLEVCFAGPGGEMEFEEWIYRRARQSLGGPLFGVLFLFLSPERVLVGASKRWSAFHRGTGLDTVAVAKSTAKLRFTCPPGLMPNAALRALRAVIRAAGITAGARAVRVDLHEESPACTLLDVRWI